MKYQSARRPTLVSRSRLVSISARRIVSRPLDSARPHTHSLSPPQSLTHTLTLTTRLPSCTHRPDSRTLHRPTPTPPGRRLSYTSFGAHREGPSSTLKTVSLHLASPSFIYPTLPLHLHPPSIHPHRPSRIAHARSPSSVRLSLVRSDPRPVDPIRSLRKSSIIRSPVPSRSPLAPRFEAMTTSFRMPLRGPGAPTFDPDAHPRSILGFFDDLEYCFELAGVQADLDKKRHALRYAPQSQQSFWRRLPEFIDPSTCFLHFKRTVRVRNTSAPMAACPSPSNTFKTASSAPRKPASALASTSPSIAGGSET